MLERLRTPVDAASAAAFRVLFGLLMFGATVRFLTSGWIESAYGEPTFFFKYYGFSWVEVPSVGWIYALQIGLALCALLIAFGLFYRVAAVLFFVGFTYAELFDVTNYLNHYYLVSLLAFWVAVLPLHRCFSLDALRKPSLRSQTLPRWCLWLLRFQVAVVYIFAGLAKFQSDWLLHAQPLNLWLTARTDIAIIGPLLDEVWVAYVASWFGFLFDTTIVFWLLWGKTRRAAYVVLIGFHFMTGVFFNIGIFPYVMTIAATLMFSASWPRRWLGRAPLPAKAAPAHTNRLARTGLLALAVVCVCQVAIPLRHLAYPGDVLWNEQGMRWSWKVMVREKHGSLTYYVRKKSGGGELQVSPRKYLTRHQEREMSTQPDLILQLAHHIRDDFAARGYGEVHVRAQALVSLNGRAAAPLIDASVDLAAVDDDLSVATWILPAPSQDPILLGGSR